MLEHQRQVRKIGCLEVTTKLITLLPSHYNASTYSKHNFLISQHQLSRLPWQLTKLQVAALTVRN
jgi:hypothetical protein